MYGFQVPKHFDKTLQLNARNYKDNKLKDNTHILDIIQLDEYDTFIDKNF